MNLMNHMVKHISWGTGTVCEHKDRYIKIKFSVVEKQFVYHLAIEVGVEDTGEE